MNDLTLIFRVHTFLKIINKVMEFEVYNLSTVLKKVMKFSKMLKNIKKVMKLDFGTIFKKSFFSFLISSGLSVTGLGISRGL